MKSLSFTALLLGTTLLQAQEVGSRGDTLRSEPLLKTENAPDFLKNIKVDLGIRAAFFHHSEKGRGPLNDNFSEFQNEFVALQIQGNVTKNVGFRYRQRFTKESTVQSLDKLDNSVEIAFVNLQASPNTQIQVGKMFAYFGGYEYDLNPIEVLEFNDIATNLSSYVTGVAVTQDLSKTQSLGFQALNSRSMRFSDIYEGQVSTHVQEPKWPLALVLNWRGSFWDGKFQTTYSISNFRMAKGHGSTRSISVGNKFQSGKFALMYDLNYYKEQLDTKGIVTNILQTDQIAEDATYLEHWVRTEYEFSPKFQGLLTLMTSLAYHQEGNENQRLRTSYGIIPTVYYKPFDKVDVRVYLAYIDRIYRFSPLAQSRPGVSNYHTGEIRLGLIAPLVLW